MGLLVGGGVTLGASYLVAVATAAGDSGSEQDGALIIPVVGPWLVLGAKQKNPCTIKVTPGTDPSAIAANQAEVKACVKDTLDAAARLAFIAADGAVQAFGAALLVAGAAGGQRVLERDDLRKVRVAPALVAGSGPGLLLDFRL